jgi:hypothetical protein
MTTKKLEKMDGLDLMHWLILACEAKGAKVFCRGTGPGDDQAELDIDLEGHPIPTSSASSDSQSRRQKAIVTPRNLPRWT